MRKSFTQRVLDGMALQDESLPAQSVVELLGNRRVLIENHDGVTKYGTECIQVQLRHGYLQIAGENLRLCRMMGRQLVVAGTIKQIQFLEEGELGCK